MARASDRPEPPEPVLDPEEPEPEEPDDEALNWAGDELRGGVAPMTRNRVASTELDDEARDDPVADPEPPTSIARTAVTALFAILYLGVVVGWILSTQLTGSAATDVFLQVAWQFGEFVALIAGALWFLAVLTLTRESSTALRIGWFALGVGVLAPWPILLALAP